MDSNNSSGNKNSSGDSGDSISAGTPDSALRTPLYDLHISHGGRMVVFGGFSLPIHYGSILDEHRHTREYAGLFDVSHMGQWRLRGRDYDSVALFLESLTPAALTSLPLEAMRYTQFTNESGGIIDDLIVTHLTDSVARLVVNASCREKDRAHIQTHLPADIDLIFDSDFALLALQGPMAREILSGFCPLAETLGFMRCVRGEIGGIDCLISCCGYTGEDGYEISVSGDKSVFLAEQLLADDRVRFSGLGARDSLRIEAGLCLYGHDISDDISPVEAGLGWSIGKSRRESGVFPGSARILRELSEGPSRYLRGFILEGRAPAREGCEIMVSGSQVGFVTSGGFSPSLGVSVAMGFIDSSYLEDDLIVNIMVRGRALKGHLRDLPFIGHRYYRG